jgi:hypothetical protein
VDCSPSPPSFIYDRLITYKEWFNVWITQDAPFITDGMIHDTDDSVILNAPLNDPTLFLSPTLMNNIKQCQTET